VNLRGVTWGEVDRILAVEVELIQRCADKAATSAEFQGFFRKAESEFTLDLPNGDEDFSTLPPLDLGTAAATLALNAAGCPTIMACNGHQTGYPYIAFWGRSQHVPLLAEAATTAGVGLINGLNGCLEILSDRPDGLTSIAAAVRDRSARFAVLRRALPKTNPVAKRQLQLPITG
jgi:hypothetical protein